MPSDSSPRFALALAAGAFLAAAAVAAPPERYEIETVADGVTIYRRTDPDGLRLNTVVVERSDGLLVVGPQDTPAAAKALLAEIAKRPGRGVRYLVMTNPHADAAGGAAAFPDEVLRIGSRGCLELLKRPEFDFAAEAALRNAGREGWAPPPRALPVLALEAATLLDDASMPVLLEPTPRAHTQGDLVVKLPGRGIQIVGELVATDRNPNAAGSSLSGWMGVLNGLAYEEPRTVIPLRGGVLGLLDLRRQRSAFLWAKGQVAQAFVDLVPSAKIAERILGSKEAGKYFDPDASPAFFRTVVDTALEEALDERRRRGLPID